MEEFATVRKYLSDLTHAVFEREIFTAYCNSTTVYDAKGNSFHFGRTNVGESRSSIEKCPDGINRLFKKKINTLFNALNQAYPFSIYRPKDPFTIVKFCYYLLLVN